MPFDRPTQAAIIDRVRGDIEGDLAGTDAYLPGSFERKSSNAIGKASHIMHGHLAHTARQFDPRKADEEVLVAVAAAHGVFRITPGATEVVITVEGVDGTSVPSGTVWTRSDGRRYASSVDHEIGEDTTGEAVITVTDELVGAAGNVSIGSTLRLSTTITGVTAAATVTAIETMGNDLEALDRLAERYSQRLSNPPKGGAIGDYERWALEVPGVTRAWEFRHRPTVGCVTLMFVCDDDADIIPTPAKVAEVSAHIHGPGRAPVTATVHVEAPTPVTITPTIQIRPNTPAVREAATNELRDYVKTSDPTGFTVLLSRLDEAISVANGEEDHALVSPAADVVLPVGSIAVLSANPVFQVMP